MKRLLSLLDWMFAKPLRLLIPGVVVIVVLVVLAFLASPSYATPVPQPIAFNHKIMVVTAGIDCVFCHSDVNRSPSAAIPSVEKCMGCHKTIATTAPEIVKVADYYNKGEPIPWQRVNYLPAFVYFSHEAHVVAGKQNCENCHGDVANMTVDVPVVRMNMGWCLRCHTKQPNGQQLRDCVTCHQ